MAKRAQAPGPEDLERLGREVARGRGRGQVDHGVDRAEPLEGRLVAGVAEHEAEVRRGGQQVEVLLSAGQEVVHTDDLVAACDQRLGQVRADHARASRHDDLHPHAPIVSPVVHGTSPSSNRADGDAPVACVREPSPGRVHGQHLPVPDGRGAARGRGAERSRRGGGLGRCVGRAGESCIRRLGGGDGPERARPVGAPESSDQPGAGGRQRPDRHDGVASRGRAGLPAPGRDRARVHPARAGRSHLAASPAARPGAAVGGPTGRDRLATRR